MLYSLQACAVSNHNDQCLVSIFVKWVETIFRLNDVGLYVYTSGSTLIGKVKINTLFLLNFCYYKYL